jgi:hypothetical protein
MRMKKGSIPIAKGLQKNLTVLRPYKGIFFPRTSLSMKPIYEPQRIRNMRPLFDQFLFQSSCNTEGSSGLFSTSHWNSSNTRMSLSFFSNAGLRVPGPVCLPSRLIGVGRPAAMVPKR